MEIGEAVLYKLAYRFWCKNIRWEFESSVGNTWLTKSTLNVIFPK